MASLYVQWSKTARHASKNIQSIAKQTVNKPHLLVNSPSKVPCNTGTDLPCCTIFVSTIFDTFQIFRALKNSFFLFFFPFFFLLPFFLLFFLPSLFFPLFFILLFLLLVVVFSFSCKAYQVYQVETLIITL